MRRAALAVGVWCVCLGACIEDEEARSYEEFVQEYEAITRRDAEAPDMKGDLAADAPEDDMGSPPLDMMMAPDMPFFIDPNNPPECSIQGGASVVVTFTNKTPNAIDLYWFNPSCAPIKYATIAPEQTHMQQTFVGHVWVFVKQFVTPVNLPERRTVILNADMTQVDLKEAP